MDGHGGLSPRDRWEPLLATVDTATGLTELLRRLKSESDYSVQAIAKRGGISPGTVQNLVTAGSGRPRWSSLAGFLLGCRLSRRQLPPWLSAYERVFPPPVAEKTGDRALTIIAPAAVDQVAVGEIPLAAVAWQDRDALLTELAALVGTGRTAVVCALAGQRGVGKTQLAAAYARHCLDRGWPVVAWVVAEDEQKIAEGLARLAHVVGAARPGTNTMTAARQAVHWLTNHQGQCLLVYDNVTDADLVARWIPSVGTVQTVVTTVDAAFHTLGPLVTVPVFTDAEAMAFLRRRTGLADDTGARELARELANLPLALDQAGSVIGATRTHREFAVYLDRLRDVPVAELLTRRPGDRYHHGTTAAVMLTLADATGEDHTGLAGRVLDVLAVLDPIGVNRSLLAAGLMGGEQASGLDACLARLAERSQVTLTVTGRQVTMHRLLQRILRDDQISADRRDVAVRRALRMLHSAAGSCGAKWEHRVEIAELATHAEALWSHAAAAGAETRKSLLGLRLELLFQSVEVFNTTSAVAVGESLAADLEDLLGADHPATLTCRHNLGYAYFELHRFEQAIPLLERTAAAERTRDPDGEDNDSLTTLQVLATAYAGADRPDEALDLLQQVYAGREKTNGPDHPLTLRSRLFLAHELLVAGHTREALAAFTLTVQALERTRGPEHPQTLGARHGLGKALLRTGRLAEAVDALERLPDAFEQRYGPAHPDVATSCSQLAAAYQGMDLPEKAVPLLERALAARETTSGADHSHTLRARLALAEGYLQVNAPDRATPLLDRALSDSVRVLENDSPYMFDVRSRLACAYHSAGRPETSRAMLTELLADQERRLDAGHPELSRTRRSLAAVHRIAGRYDDAVPLLVRAHDDLRARLGPYHFDTQMSCIELAETCRLSGRRAEAITHFHEALRAAEERVGPDGGMAVKLRRAVRELGGPTP
ncbi:tetratricopeptide repeat protein [Winogradskya humida]|uniref:Tetratricopeptide repeat protein n=1 Tax=Winogradskya humida TaxID=113566 RepID=A0ABQ3ZIA6_9ACTN|nr:tetratricopeptide repeat protein [Actinoplanes humidus]GIE18325.1 hypothetical protein Ahu01nite_014270 [Actinoplanes humidus]